MITHDEISIRALGPHTGDRQYVTRFRNTGLVAETRLP